MPSFFVFSDAEQGEKQVNYIPGVPFIRVADLPRDPFGIEGRKILKKVMDGILMVSSKSQYLLLTSFYELESKVLDSLKKELLPLPIYCIGPTIPYFSSTTKEFGSQTITNGHQKTDYISWLDAQPESSVLYISQGSFLSASNEQLVEVIAGVHDSGVNFLWVARADQGSLPCGKILYIQYKFIFISCVKVSILLENIAKMIHFFTFFQYEVYSFFWHLCHSIFFCLSFMLLNFLQWPKIPKCVDIWCFKQRSLYKLYMICS